MPLARRLRALCVPVSLCAPSPVYAHIPRRGEGRGLIWAGLPEVAFVGVPGWVGMCCFRGRRRRWCRVRHVLAGCLWSSLRSCCRRRRGVLVVTRGVKPKLALAVDVATTATEGGRVVGRVPPCGRHGDGAVVCGEWGWLGGCICAGCGRCTCWRWAVRRERGRGAYRVLLGLSSSSALPMCWGRAPLSTPSCRVLVARGRVRVRAGRQRGWASTWDGGGSPGVRVGSYSL